MRELECCQPSDSLLVSDEKTEPCQCCRAAEPIATESSSFIVVAGGRDDQRTNEQAGCHGSAQRNAEVGGIKTVLPAFVMVVAIAFLIVAIVIVVSHRNCPLLSGFCRNSKSGQTQASKLLAQHKARVRPPERPLQREICCSV